MKLKVNNVGLAGWQTRKRHRNGEAMLPFLSAKSVLTALCVCNNLFLYEQNSFTQLCDTMLILLC